MKTSKSTMILGTRKGLIEFQKKGREWKYKGVSFLGEPVSLAYVDPRHNIWWACLDHGHWGSKLHRSDDHGKTWKEVEAPKYPIGAEVSDGVPASLRYLWAFSHGGNDHADRIYVGTEPGGLFRSEDGGDTFELVESLWNHPTRKEKWYGGGRDHAGIHSIFVDPRDSRRILVGISVAGVFESVDDGSSWEPRNKGLRADFLPNPDADVGQDPHLLVAAPSNPDVLWQQNHCGIFMSENGGVQWHDVSQKGGPAYFGFAVAVDEEDPMCAWVVPAISDETRTAIKGALCVCRTDDGGKSWKKFTAGLPQEGVFDITYRHAMDLSGDTIAFGTTTGNLFLSENRGESWKSVSHHLPMIHSLCFI